MPAVSWWSPCQSIAANPQRASRCQSAIATLRTPRAAARQDGTSWSLPVQGCDGPEIENALVERERLADAALVAGRSRAQPRQPGVGQPIRGQVLGRPMILDQGNDRDFLQGTLLGELPRLPLRHCTDRRREGSDEGKRR